MNSHHRAFKLEELQCELGHEDTFYGRRGDLRHNSPEWDTFDGWKARGCIIVKGSKATKIAGINKFHVSSVIKKG